MKSIFFISAFVFLLTGICTVSCNKENTPPTPNQIDSIKNRLPKQVFISSVLVSDTFPPFNGIVSIKYDTTHFKIELYINDTTNSDPDKVLMRYSFNNDGYLVSRIYNPLPTLGGYISIPDTVTIERSADNKIISIKSTVSNMHINYSYQSSGGNLIIKLEQPRLTQFYTFNSNFKCLSLYTPSLEPDYYSDWDETFLYNPNGSLDSLVTNQWQMYPTSDLGTWEKTYLKVTEKFLYSSGIPDEKEDLLIKTLLGKDYYILSLYREVPLYYFSFGLSDSPSESYYYSLTNPYHTSQIISVYKSGNHFFNNTTNIKYELNNQGLLSLLNLISTGDATNQNTTLKFKY